MAPSAHSAGERQRFARGAPSAAAVCGTCGSTAGHASASTSALASAASPRCTALAMPADSSAPPAAAPAIPPTLNMPCSIDMIGLPNADSTALASAFIATSSVAIEKPNSASTASSSG